MRNPHPLVAFLCFDSKLEYVLSASVVFLAVVSMGFGSQSLPDPGQIGPYDVGHTSFVITDSSRTAMVGTPPSSQPRPIPVHLFYPVDPEAISQTTSEAVYPLDMIYRPTEARFQTLSSEWEAQGIDRAYQEPPTSTAKPFPLVTFSPGWGAAAWDHLFVGTRLASHGFVVAIVYHYGDRIWSYEPAADHLAVASMNRPLDISFTLTHLLQRNATLGDTLFGLIDPSRIAAAGWSLGGYGAMVLAGGDDSVCDKIYGLMPTDPPPSTCVPSPPDPRIRAIVPLDGSNQLLWFDELARIAVPTMGIGEEWSTLATNMPGWDSWQARLHAASQGHPAYRADMQGTIHQSFGNLCESTPILYAHRMISKTTYENRLRILCGVPLPTNEAHRLTTKYMIAFLKTNLAGETGYQPVLTPGHALRFESMVEFFVTEKRNPSSIQVDWPGYYVYFMHQPGSEQAKAEKDSRSVLGVAYFGFEEGKK